LGFAITEVNRGDYAVMLKENRHRSTEAVTTEIRGKILASVPGLEVEFIQVLQDLIGDLAGNPSPIEIKLYGEDQNVLVEQAKALVEKLGGIHGLVDAQSGAIEAGPAVTLKLDESTIGRLGLTTSDVTRQANAALYGTVATQALVGDRGVAVRVRLPQSVRDNPDSLRDIQIRASNGGLYPLASLGSIVTIPGETQTAREDQRRIVAVTAQLEGVDLGTAVTKVKALMANTPLPTGVTYTLGGQFESQQETFTNLILVLGLAVLAVFTVMLFQFRSFTGPAVILFLMPLSLAGAVSALYLTSIPLNVSSFMGAIMLAGIVVKNGILLLDRAQAAIDGGLSADAAVQQAGEERLRPILMTTAAAILGLLPLSLGLGAGAQMQQPLAIVVIGGLLYSTVLSLVLGPVLYAFIRRSARATTLKPESSR
jgi:multidrug efflux pump subunit AcrB